MNVPPAILDMHVDRPERGPVHVWLPLFLLWPLLFALGVVALVLTLLVDTTLLVLGQRYHHYSILLFRCFAAMTETRGMVIRVNDDKTALDMTFL